MSAPVWATAQPVSPNQVSGAPALANFDILGDADSERYAAAARIVLEDKNVDGLLVLLTPQAMTDPTACAEGVISAAKKTQKPVLACWMGENRVAEAIDVLDRAIEAVRVVGDDEAVRAGRRDQQCALGLLLADDIVHVWQR